MKAFSILRMNKKKTPPFVTLPLPRCLCVLDCQFELGGADGLIRSSQVEEENKVKPDQAVDCIWTIRAPPNYKVSRHVMSTRSTSNERGFQQTPFIPV